MKKSDLIEILAEEAEVSKRAAQETVELFFELMIDALEKGERIEIRGLGSFRIHHYGGYTGRNPRTGESVEVLPKRLPLFRQSSLLEIED